MKKLAHLTLLPAMLLVSGMAMAAGISNGSLDKLMELSGINKQVEDIPAGVVAGMQQSMQQGAPIKQEQFAKLEQAVLQAFKPADINATISGALKKSLSEAEAQELLAWYQSDLGRKITKAEEDASGPEAYQDMMKQAQSLMANKSRVQMAQRIDSLVNASEMTMEFQKNTAIAVFTSLSKAMNPGQPVNIEGFKAQMAKDEPKMRQQITQLVTLSLVYNYRNIDDGDMEKYMDFLEQPATKKFNDNAISGMKIAINKSVNTMADSLATIFTAQK